MGLDIMFKVHSTIGYFRKVNFLVKFFSDYGLDVESQTPICVTYEQIVELTDRCNAVLNHHNWASSLLPTMNGFFFGSIDYDDNYFEDVLSVLNYCQNILLPKFKTLKDTENIYFEIWY